MDQPTKHQMRFETPQNYFEELENRVSGAVQNELIQTAAHTKRNTLYVVPSGYFEALIERILNRLHQERSSVSQWQPSFSIELGLQLSLVSAIILLAVGINLTRPEIKKETHQPIVDLAYHDAYQYNLVTDGIDKEAYRKAAEDLIKQAKPGQVSNPVRDHQVEIEIGNGLSGSSYDDTDWSQTEK